MAHFKPQITLLAGKEKKEKKRKASLVRQNFQTLNYESKGTKMCHLLFICQNIAQSLKVKAGEAREIHGK